MGNGDVWTWTAIDVGSKLIVSYSVGKRDANYAQAFMADVAGRLAIDFTVAMVSPGSFVSSAVAP